MRIILKIAIVFVFAVLFNACSTVLNTTTQAVELTTAPVGAKITIDGKKFGTTPQTVNIDRGSNHVVKFELDGFDAYETQLTRKISFWFWGNALNGFVPGMLIDMFTGSMYNILPEKVEVNLNQSKAEPPAKKK